MSSKIVFLDTEVSIENNKICDIGAIDNHGTVLHTKSIDRLMNFVSNSEYICGHNVLHHDLKFIESARGEKIKSNIIDTLYLSPLLFPKRPYHSLLKDDKLQTDELNNPVNDCKKAASLFYDELNAFFSISSRLKSIYCSLLYSFPEFKGFFDYADFKPERTNLIKLIKKEFNKKICDNADLTPLINHYPIELAYSLALISSNDNNSITPPWLLKNFPKIENVIKYLRNTPCDKGCSYCKSVLDIHKALKNFFGYHDFRKYNGENLQERAVQAAVDGKSVLAVFPTGGGKSITFQLPALMAGQTIHGLTVVISPLQSLMKDQVDNLNERGIIGAVTVNGLLDPIERANSLERVSNGSATLLYISPEQLRSKTIEKILISRNVSRFVIDEAHCFSAWGQDFRVDYLYIGDFIRKLQKSKKGNNPIPVSCFTATAKQKVITDICDYFKRKLDLDLEIFASSATRENLHYTVLYKETDEEKYNTLRNLISQKNCPTIVYVSRTKKTHELAERLTSDGFPAKPFNGKMDPNDKIQNQEAFIRNEVKVIVATSAFGMGVDKKDVKLVVHYEISSSLEDYVQEAGRAGRDPSLQAECFVLFNDNDLDKHFILLNQTKLSISEIQQVWRAVKELTKLRPSICCSPLEIARQAGWDDSVNDIETRVKTAISALETAGYIKRGRNVPHVYATSILAKDMVEASLKIETSTLYSDKQKMDAKRIIKALISSRSIASAGNDVAESRIDYLADILGLSKSDVIDAVNLMRQDSLLADSMDMSAYIFASDTENKSMLVLERFSKLERFLISQFTDEGCEVNIKELNEQALGNGINSSTVKNIRTLMFYHTIKNYIHKPQFNSSSVLLVPTMEISKLITKFELRIDLCKFIISELFSMASNVPASQRGEKPILFSLVGLFQQYQSTPSFNSSAKDITLHDVEDALLYLSKIGALRLEGGFLVLYNGMEIKRIITDNRIQYKLDDYRFLDEFYKQKIQQIHIVGEYANLMVRDYNAALEFVQNYFQMDFKKFIAKYFSGDRAKEIERNITPDKYHQLFGELSDKQSEIISDSESKYIVVAAGPGSGKTRVLVHKLAALLLLEDVKHEQLLMLTFSRAAATEFKKRLFGLIGNASSFVEIKTFHSYCFDLLGKIGSLEGANDVVKDASELIMNGEVEQGRITKSVLVIDEAQDMSEQEFSLVRALMHNNDNMRLIAVGDDDQNIYEFRGSSSAYLRTLISEYGARKYEMTENYRSCSNIVSLANAFAKSINNRMKSAPIESVNSKSGIVRITHHSCANMEEAVVNQLIRTRKDNRCCVLTSTNDEALQITGLLTRKNVRAKLIQSLDGFNLYDLVEIRYFLKQIDRGLKTPVIPNNLWSKAKEKLCSAYSESSCLEICKNLIRDFETTNRTKYRNDLQEFIKESKYEDFYNDEKGIVYVSTIHKSQGHEFDAVYIMLKGDTAKTDEEKRKIYVGMTRAKSELYIHSNTELFDNYHMDDVVHISDNTDYSTAQEISVQLSHRDVVLDFFKGKKDIIFKLRSGDKLSVSNSYLTAEVNGRSVAIAKFSKAFCEKLLHLEKLGYKPVDGKIRFIVAWKGENDTEETAVVLADMKLSK